MPEFEHLGALWHYWVVGVIGSVIAVEEGLRVGHAKFREFGWRRFLTILLVTLVLAQYLAWDDMREQRDKALLESAVPLDLFVPLEGEIKSRMVDRLVALRRDGLKLTVGIACVTGDPSRTNVCRQLGDILTSSGFHESPPDVVDYVFQHPAPNAGKFYVPAPVVFSFRGTEESTVSSVLRISQELDLMLRIAPLLNPDETMPPGSLRIEIGGRPQFFGDGTVAFVR